MVRVPLVAHITLRVPDARGDSFVEFDVTKTIDLVENGSNIAVTRENRLRYIYLVSHYRLNAQIKQQSEV